MVNRQPERSCWFRLSRSVVAGVGFAAVFAAFSAALATQTLAGTTTGDLRGDIQAGVQLALADAAFAKVFPPDTQGQDGTDLALFPKVRNVPRGPGLDRETRCSWWLPSELPLGGGFTYALLCGGQADMPYLSDS